MPKMAEKSLSADDCVLLQLMDKFKPHLKPYAYRQDAWSRVLNEYNGLTGSLYRQARTLRVKFEKMKQLCKDSHRGNIDLENFELLKKLADETGEGKSKRSKVKKNHVKKMASAESSLRPDFNIDHKSSTLLADEVEIIAPQSNTAQRNDGLQPPPLDSIVVGFGQGLDPASLATLPTYDHPMARDYDGSSPLSNKSSISRLHQNQNGSPAMEEEDDDPTQPPPLDSITVGFRQAQKSRNHQLDDVARSGT